MIDWTISLGNLGTIIAIIFFGSGFYWKQLIDMKVFRGDIIDIKTDLKVLNSVVTNLALQNQRIDNISERLMRFDKQMDELRHGMGFIK